MPRILVVLLLVFGALALVAACNEESDFLLDESEPEATGTPAFFQRTPQPSPAPSPVGSPPAPGATPVTPFKVDVEQSVNKRSSPSIEGGEGTVVGTLVPGETATVTAEIRGEEVNEGNDIWYQLEDGSFVYSGVVTRVEEEAGEEATATATGEATE